MFVSHGCEELAIAIAHKNALVNCNLVIKMCERYEEIFYQRGKTMNR